MQNTADPSFGKLLREFRLAAQLSQDGLAERAAMSADGISALERGVNRAPQRETLALLVNALDLEPQQRRALETAARRRSKPRRLELSVAKRHNLARLASPLFGREHDLVIVSALIARAQVVTVTGSGGVGKTRLAIELGHRALEDNPDGAWFVDLAAERDGSAVSAAIATVMGIHENPARPLIDGIADALARKTLLLILDNCEHVAATVAGAVEKIAGECPNVRILATSRQPLGIAGEQTYRLASLDLDASVALFADTARRVEPSLSLDDDLATVERICRRLDGIALAIELAAARVRLLSVAQVEELLSERFQVLTGGGPLERHQTMRALVDWSYDLLPEQERTLFSRLGVFPADFSFEAAMEICSDETIGASRALDLAGSLVDKSLLTSEPRGKARRFRLLETMRAYALERLGAGISQLNARHAQYYVRLAESADSRTVEGAETLETEYDNLRRALDWAIDESGDVPLGIRLLGGLREFLLYRGLAADSARRAERAIDGRAPLTRRLQAVAWETIAAMRGDLLMPAAAFEASTKALTFFEELEDFAGVARALRGRGVAHLRLGNFVQAEADLQRSLELSKKYDDARAVARTLGSIAVGYEMMGRPQEGRNVMLEVLEMSRQTGDERVIGVTLINLAEAEFALGESGNSVGHLRELLASRASRKNVRLRANAKANLAVYLLAMQRDEEARSAARAAISEAREAGDAGIAACAIQHLASIVCRFDPRTAAKLLGYVNAVFAAGYRRENTERFTHALLLSGLRERLSKDQIAALEHEGAAMSELQAARLATRSARS